jgi:hypothetical protein
MPGGGTGWRKPCTRILLIGPPLSSRRSLPMESGADLSAGRFGESMPRSVIAEIGRPHKVAATVHSADRERSPEICTRV